MKKKITADLKRFYCQIAFDIECDEKDFLNMVEHYEHLLSFYNIEGKMTHWKIENDEHGQPLHFDLYYFQIDISKEITSNYHLSTTALRAVFLNDLHLLRQLYYLNDVRFESPLLKDKVYWISTL